MHVRRTPTGRGAAASGRSTSGRGGSTRARRLLTGALVVTGLVVALGVSGAAGLEPVRGAAAAVLGPLERLLGPGDDEVSAARAEQAVLATRLAAARREVAARHAVAGILESPALAGARLVPARVVAVGASGPAGPERVTIDAGSRDGVEVDRTVVAADGLVGRVVAVAPWTSDVLLVGSADLTVGVRVGPRGVLGEASGAAVAGGPAARARPALLRARRPRHRHRRRRRHHPRQRRRPPLRARHPGRARCTTVHHGVGRLAPTGTVTPAVDTTSLDVVAVVLTTGRTTPRPVATGTG